MGYVYCMQVINLYWNIFNCFQGHASENPKLPELLHKKGIVFLGPPEKGKDKINL